MTGTELAVPEQSEVAPAMHPLDAKLRYARFLSSSGLLPQAFRKEPGNVLYAVEYGEMLGLPPMAAITGIHVIEGRPSISAGLISALVRRAGHKLRVTGDDHQAQAQLVRADDPNFTYKSTWTLERAKQADLLNKTNWKRYPDAMLKARAISEVARDACQEVLLGMQYTADELGDMYDDGGEVIHDGFDTLPNGAIDQGKLSEDTKDAIGLMPRGQRVQHEALRRDGEPAPSAVQKLDGTPDDDPWLTQAPAAGTTPDAPPPVTTQAGKAALEKLQDLERQLLGTWPDDEVRETYERITGGEWTANRKQVQDVTSLLTDALKAAKGDVEAASSSLWKQFHA